MGKLDLLLGPLTSHSFRVGLATMMAKAGCPDKDIQLTGRWTSTAFKSYVKTARPNRAALAASIWNTLAQSGVHYKHGSQNDTEAVCRKAGPNDMENGTNQRSLTQTISGAELDEIYNPNQTFGEGSEDEADGVGQVSNCIGKV